MNVEIVELPEMRVATVSHKGPYNQIDSAFGKLGQLAGPAGLFGPSATMIGIYYDDPQTTPAADLRSDAGITISPDAKLPQGLSEQTIPAGSYARTTYVGPYEGLPDTWAEFMEKGIPATGHPLRDGLSFEIYRNSPGDVPNDKLITELCIAIA